MYLLILMIYISQVLLARSIQPYLPGRETEAASQKRSVNFQYGSYVLGTSVLFGNLSVICIWIAYAY
jgi:hypothetical protein